MLEATLYDYLLGTKISEVTIANLDNAVKESFVNQSSINFWKGPITVSKVLESTRTYPHGIAIPSASSCESASVDDASLGTMKPTGTEVWRVQAIDSNHAVTYALFDGSVSVPISGATADPYIPQSPIYLTPTLYLTIANGSGSTATVNLAYHKVSL
jgi:hypothetical protein